MPEQAVMRQITPCSRRKSLPARMVPGKKEDQMNSNLTAIIVLVSAFVRACGGLLVGAALAVGLAGSLAGIASAAAAVPSVLASSQTGGVSLATGLTLAADQVSGSPQACTAYAYAAIEGHTVVTATPAACEGLARAQVNQAVGTAIDMTLANGARSAGREQGSKPARRRQAAAAAVWVRALITAPGPAPASPPATSSGGRPSSGVLSGSVSSGLRLGGVSELAAQVGALLAWLAAAASGGLVLARWLRAGGSPLRRTATAAPPAAILGHVGGGLLGLALWAAFMLSGWTVLAWIALGLLAPVAGAGMAVLVLGLPRPGRPGLTARRPRMPVLAIFAHGLFAAIALLLVLMATIGA
jgi:hypothetical protein